MANKKIAAPAATLAAPAATPVPAAKYAGALPKGCSVDDHLAHGKKYSPRPNCKFSTQNQWADLNLAIEADQTVGEILAEYALVNISQGQVDKGYLNYVIGRGWITVIGA